MPFSSTVLVAAAEVDAEECAVFGCVLPDGGLEASIFDGCDGFVVCLCHLLTPVYWVELFSRPTVLAERFNLGVSGVVMTQANRRRMLTVMKLPSSHRFKVTVSPTLMCWLPRTTLIFSFATTPLKITGPASAETDMLKAAIGEAENKTNRANASEGISRDVPICVGCRFHSGQAGVRGRLIRTHM